MTVYFLHVLLIMHLSGHCFVLFCFAFLALKKMRIEICHQLYHVFAYLCPELHMVSFKIFIYLKSISYLLSFRVVVI